MEKDIPCKEKSKERVAILVSDKRDFKINTVAKDEEGQGSTTIRGSIQEEVTHINLYAPPIRPPQCKR